jgi:hypothetical protein
MGDAIEMRPGIRQSLNEPAGGDVYPYAGLRRAKLVLIRDHLREAGILVYDKPEQAEAHVDAVAALLADYIQLVADSLERAVEEG